MWTVIGHYALGLGAVTLCVLLFIFATALAASATTVPLIGSWLGRNINHIRDWALVAAILALSSYGLTLEELFARLENNNVTAGGGYIVHHNEQRMIRGQAMLKGLSDIEEIVMRRQDGGTPILVRDIANVVIAPMTRQGAVTRDGRGEADADHHQDAAMAVVQRDVGPFHETPLAALGEGDHAGGGALAFGVFQNQRIAAVHYRHAGIRGSQINAQYFCHKIYLDKTFRGILRNEGAKRARYFLKHTTSNT